MKNGLILALVLVSTGAALAADAHAVRPALYIAPSNGFQGALMAAMEKKRVPVVLMADAAGARYELDATPAKVKTQTTGSKVARCLFADCIGIEDSSTVSVQLTDNSSKQVVWAYSVHKQWGGSRNEQAMAEAVAKHLKQYLQKNPLETTPLPTTQAR